MKLKLLDGTTIEVSDTSSASSLDILANSYEEASDLAKHFTDENLKKVTIGDTVYERLRYVDEHFYKNRNTSRLTINLRQETEDEKRDIRIRDLEEAIAALQLGNMEV